MGYQFSNQTKTLTHWQSGIGGGVKPVPRTTAPFIGVIHNGMPYFFPFECWDPGSDVVYVSRQSETDSYTAAHPLLANYYGYKYDVSQNKPMYSAYKWDSEEKQYMYFSAIYSLYENKPLEWKTRDTEGNYGYYATGSWTPYETAKISESYSIKAGGSYGVCVPTFNAYIMLTGRCPAAQADKLPEWLKTYPHSSGYYKLYYFEPPSLAPSLFKGLGKMNKNWKLIAADSTRDKTGGAGLWGTSSALASYDVSSMVSSGYCGMYPLCLGGPDAETRAQPLTGGSCVKTALVDQLIVNMPSVRIPIARDGLYWANTGSLRIYPIDGDKACYCDLTVTREPVSYGLTTGVLWKNEEVQKG